MRCMRFQSNKKPLDTKEGADNATLTACARANKKNDNSPQSYQEFPALDHSTPIRQKHSWNGMEDSSDLDCCPSPILLPSTQEGGNEVGWDWQSSLRRTPDSRNRRNVQCETPKRTKVLQRKRNSNSPLLYKPLKRKTIKLENIENIGQFTAELQALNEKVRIIRQSDKSHLGDYVEEGASTVINVSDNKEARNNEQSCTEKSNGHNKCSKTSASYDDLFDDSIDDSMARCTQEIEEKFNLIVVEGNFTAHSPTSVKREVSFCANNANDKTLCVQFPLDENSMGISAESFYHEAANDNNSLKTYSKLPLKRDVNSSVHFLTRQNDNLHPTYPTYNNDTMRSCDTEKLDVKKLSKESSVELFDIPDDSFDDCLATCVEDEKLLSTESSVSLACGNDNTKFGTGCKLLTCAPLKGKFSRNNVVSKTKLANSFTPTPKEISSASLGNRKFFKTKSLSDQYINQDTITNAKHTATAVSALRYATKSTSQLNSLSNRCSLLQSRTSFMRASISTNSLATIDCRKVEDGAMLLKRSNAGRTHVSDVDKSAIKEVGDRFIKYNSTGNMKNDTKEPAKTGSQPTRCTAEEIERKRLQAKMRLEAKRKLYSMKINNNR